LELELFRLILVFDLVVRIKPIVRLVEQLAQVDLLRTVALLLEVVVASFPDYRLAPEVVLVLDDELMRCLLDLARVG